MNSEPVADKMIRLPYGNYVRAGQIKSIHVRNLMNPDEPFVSVIIQYSDKVFDESNNVHVFHYSNASEANKVAEDIAQQINGRLLDSLIPHNQPTNVK